MPASRFRKGDRVRFRLGLRFVQGEVKEDRGPIGVKGRHLYVVEFRVAAEAEAPSFVELPAEEMRSVSDQVSTE